VKNKVLDMFTRVKIGGMASKNTGSSSKTNKGKTIESKQRKLYFGKKED